MQNNGMSFMKLMPFSQIRFRVIGGNGADHSEIEAG